jgi:hypothetical protein
VPACYWLGCFGGEEHRDSWYSSFNLELNFVTSISLSYILQIPRFFFLIVSKITIFSLMMLFLHILFRDTIYMLLSSSA